jgi:TPR repeat protein
MKAFIMKHKKSILIGAVVVAMLVALATLSVPKTATADEAKAAPPAEPPPAEKSDAADQAAAPADAKGAKGEAKLEESEKAPEETPAPPDPVKLLVDMVDEPAGKVRVLGSLAVANLQADKPAEAKPLLEAAMAQIEALEAGDEKLAVVSQLATVLADFGSNADVAAFSAQLAEMEKALNPAAHAAKSLVASLSAPELQVRVLSQIAAVLSQAGDAKLAIAVLKQAQANASAIEAGTAQMAALTYVAVAQLAMGQEKPALAMFGKLQTDMDALKDSEERLTAFGNMATALAGLAEHQAVEPYLAHAQAKLRQLRYQADPILRLVGGIDEANGRVRVLCNLAANLSKNGDAEQSAAMLKKAQELIGDLTKPTELAPALTHLAHAQAAMGQVDASKATLAKAMAQVDAIQSIEDQTAALGKLVIAVDSLNDAKHLQAVLAQTLKTSNLIQQRAQAVMQQSLRLINQLPAGEQKVAALQQIVTSVENTNPTGFYTDLQFELGRLHQEGANLPRNPAAAAACYRKAAELGHTRAQAVLGQMHLHGELKPADLNEAFKWLSAASRSGDAEGQLTLGMMYALGKGAEPNLIRANQWVTLAAEQGHPQAVQARDQLATKLTSAERAESEKLIKEWQDQQTKPAAPTPKPATKPAEPEKTVKK